METRHERWVWLDVEGKDSKVVELLSLRRVTVQ